MAKVTKLDVTADGGYVAIVELDNNAKLTGKFRTVPKGEMNRRGKFVVKRDQDDNALFSTTLKVVTQIPADGTIAIPESIPSSLISILRSKDPKYEVLADADYVLKQRTIDDEREPSLTLFDPEDDALATMHIWYQPVEQEFTLG